VLQTLELTEIYKPIQKDLKRFEEMSAEELSVNDPFLQSLHNYLLNISGKHMRPALAMLCYRLFGSDSDQPIRAALAIELLHTATLVHDDVIDSSMFRRNQLSMNAKWGNDVSIICGDYLYAKAFLILSSLKDSHIFTLFSDCAKKICQGEMKQLETRRGVAMSESSYLDMIENKTSTLFETACEVGGYLSGQNKETLSALKEYGRNLGMVFQITDDCLDIMGTEENIGKNTGLDLQQNDATLPMIYLYEALDEKKRQEIKERLSQLHPENRSQISSQIKALASSLGIFEKCQLKTKGYAEAALQAMKQLPDSPYRRSLLDLIDFTLQRVM
jgi:octaprenyl-diphosphate synthase